ncbi:MAG: hypothetical protein Q4G49_16230 [Paracoccus sp. (in: a-proteobacteria)]|nr:hypothetical protein [Paracoccus sp. (in: a-proteobacteria)]
MSDYLLLGGVALCILSVVFAVVQLAQTRPPRAAAILLVFGIAALLAAAFLTPDTLTPLDIAGAWARVTAQ